MNWPYELQIGWRYTRAGRAGRRNGFISFISGVSMLGIALGVMALIVVLSVMNGFQKDVRDRMLSVIPHIEAMDVTGNGLSDWISVAEKARQNKAVVGAAPFIANQTLVARGDQMLGVIVRGVLPSMEGQVTDLERQLRGASLNALQPGQWRIVLGSELARSLGVQVGDAVTVVSPSGQMTPAGIVPRLKQFTVVSVFHSGHYEYDKGLAMVHIDDAARLFQINGVSGVQLKLVDLHEAREVAAQLGQTLGQQVYVRDWTRTNANWFQAVQIEKRMMFIILTLIVAVAMFNLVSTLVMTVTDKQADIAILRTLGASPRSIMGVFMVQGAISGILGTASGVLIGLLVAFNIDIIVPAFEALLGFSFAKGDVYLLSYIPSEPMMSDVLPITLISLALAFVATIYPSWRASRVQPAEALRYE